MLRDILSNPVFFYTIVLVTSILSTTVGTGGGFVLIPLAAMQFGAKESVGILTIYYLFQNINKIAVFHKHIRWSIGVQVIAWSLPGALLGSFALGYIPVDLFKKILAVIVLVYLANEVFRFVPQRTQEPKKLLPVMSLLYGFLSGFIGNGNIVKGPLFMSLGMLKQAYIATYAFTSFFINVPKLVTYAATAIIDSTALVKSIPFLFLSIVGTYIGKHFLHKIRSDIFSTVITISFVLSAVALLIE